MLFWHMAFHSELGHKDLFGIYVLPLPMNHIPDMTSTVLPLLE
jgi:hypothetical protein